MLDVRRLRVLREVARHGSLSAAATSMGYTQPAVSRQIALLESETGVQLFHRLPQGVALTDAGQLLVARMDLVLADLDRVEEELQAYAGLTGGKLRMATFASAAASVVPLALTRFRERYPAVELTVIVADQLDGVPQLRAGDLDLAICNQPDDSRIRAGSRYSQDGAGLPLEFLHLFDDPMYVALPSGHPLAEAAELDLASLANESWMLAASTTCPDAELFLEACRAVDMNPQIAFEYDDYAALLGFVAAGVGISVIPDMITRTARSDVVVRDLDPPLPCRPVNAAVHVGYRSPAVQAMLEILLDLAPEWVSGGLRESQALTG